MKSLLAGALALAFSPIASDGIERLDPPVVSASGYLNGFAVPLPPIEQQGEAAAAPVFFLEQAQIDAVCGGTDQIVACAKVGGGFIALPNPCQARFRGESFAAVACHEKGHTLGWSHG